MHFYLGVSHISISEAITKWRFEIQKTSNFKVHGLSIVIKNLSKKKKTNKQKQNKTKQATRQRKLEISNYNIQL